MKPAVLVGQAIGDALGMPFEKFGDEVHEDLAAWGGEFRKGTYHDLPPGHWTDDTEMAEALATSLVSLHGYDIHDAACKYLYWISATPHGAGATTKAALKRFEIYQDPTKCGIEFDDPVKVGSGPAMRAAPLGAFIQNRFQLWKACEQDAQITHKHPEAVASSFAVALAVRFAIEKYPPIDLLAEVIEYVADATWSPGRPMSLVQLNLRSVLLDLQTESMELQFLSGRHLGRRGNASQITATAIYCALRYDNFRDGVIAAVKMGGDADTRGAIAGAILGARFGMEGIPADYFHGVKDGARLAGLDQRLVKP